MYRVDTPILDVLSDPFFESWGDYLFPFGRKYIDETWTLNDVCRLMPYHSNVDAETTVSVLNYLRAEAKSRKVYYGIYREGEIEEDESRKDSGLFFFPGMKNAPFALIAAGGGAYLASIHESLPAALEVSKRGLNAFVLQYRINREEEAVADYERALSFILSNSRAFSVSDRNYSLWGFAEGGDAAMAVSEKRLYSPSALVLIYAGCSFASPLYLPVFMALGGDDETAFDAGERLKRYEIAFEADIYPDIAQGFGLGIGTAAYGWLDKALAFIKRNYRF